MEPFELKGTVKPNRGDGRKLGYPTANIEVPRDTAEGIFSGWVELRGQKYPAMVFIGSAVTLNDPLKRAEAHMLDFADQDLYGEEISITVVHKHRDNQKFASQAELIAALRQDEAAARKFFKQESK